MEWIEILLNIEIFQKIRNNYYTSYTIDHGVPLGSILYPIIFYIILFHY